MPSDVAPICPSCFHRVVAWTAANCPACKQSSPVAACDHCRKSRAGAFVPEPADGKAAAASGGAQRFLCVDCMEGILDESVSERLRDSVLAVILTVTAVFLTAAHPAFIYALFAASAACFLFWWLAVRNRSEPERHVASLWKLFRARLDRALKKRATATR